MIRKIFKWTGVTLAVILLLAVLSYGYISNDISSRLKMRYEFAPEAIDVPSDSITLARGRHLVAIKGCNDCHGAKLAGRVMIENGGLGRIVATNLTKGAGGIPENYSDADWAMALRHGVNRSGRPLVLMPSHETAVLSTHDMEAIIAYCRQVPRVDNQLPMQSIGPVSRIMTYLDKMPLLSVDKINHDAQPINVVDTTEGVALGEYLSVSCSGCHRPDMRGGDPIAPGFPQVPDITSAGNPGKWTQSQFVTALRAGKTPGGHQMRNEDMPWKMTAQYDDKELASLYQYLQSLK